MSRPTGGWVKLHRRIVNSWVSDDPVAFTMICLLVMWANRSRGRSMLHRSLVTLERGQVATGRDELRKKLRCSANKVDRLLLRMQTDSIVSSKRSNSGSIITILNYDEYQLSEEDIDAAKRAANEAASEAATGAASEAHREKREGRNKKLGCALFGETKKKRVKNVAGSLKVSPTNRSRNAVTAVVGLLRAQFARAGEGHELTAAEAEREARIKLPAEAAALLKLKYPTWAQFVSAYTTQSRRGFGPAFERDLAGEFFSAIKGEQIPVSSAADELSLAGEPPDPAPTEPASWPDDPGLQQTGSL